MIPVTAIQLAAVAPPACKVKDILHYRSPVRGSARRCFDFCSSMLVSQYTLDDDIHFAWQNDEPARWPSEKPLEWQIRHFSLFMNGSSVVNKSNSHIAFLKLVTAE
jgi:hypothetical protein